MVSFKVVNALTMYVIFFLQDQCTSVRTVTENRVYCIRQISTFFPGENVQENAMYALENYSKETKMNFIAKSYYNAFISYLNSEHIPEPWKFCETSPSRETCKNILTKYFSEDPLQSLIRAFYFYDQNAIVEISIDIVEHYWVEIIQKFYVLSLPGFMNDPIEYCIKYYPKIQEPGSFKDAMTLVNST